ncbi:helix-turn-helix domain-containing protein [Cellulomonas denverensis]|uniref:Helix-turn-helix domain-containing protein n=1 Tax=Cellulomonas denverensis TaxID=264297 RepID=A0A7X6QXX0_9CELL|nr:helix-turn-helix domain-containing protein [Cellulomonas denverensis]NKY21503.1 helix-turn-helix domain-containing protein [Cellulomonas denverensis]GIG27015.1 hypothetical protein Cde04nite_32590 [Cellulomonas denverensis]
METVAEVAARTGLSDRRVRALIADGALPATKIGTRYVVDELDVDAFLRHTRPPHTRAMAPRIAWAVAALLDGASPTWLRSDELSRLRSRLSRTSLPVVWRTWARHLAMEQLSLRGSADQVEAVLADASTVRSGRSATTLVTDPLVGAPGAVVWTRSAEEAERLRRTLGLLRSAAGNVTINVPPPIGLTGLGADGVNAFRLVVARDLLDEDEPRARSAGEALLHSVAGDAARLLS